MGMLGVTGRVALAKTKVSSTDVIPNAISPSNVSGGDNGTSCMDDVKGIFYTTPIQITGISTSITLRIGVTESGDGANNFEICTSSNTSWNNATSVAQGFTSFTEKTTDITIANNEYLIMRISVCNEGCLSFATGNVTIKNMSDGAVTLGSFTYNIQYASYYC